VIHGVNVIGSNHYEKSCMQKLHYHVTRGLKQPLYNYTTIVSWKYRELKNKMSRYNFLEFLCSCTLVLRLYKNECTHHTYKFFNHCLILLINCTKITYDNCITMIITKALINNLCVIILEVLYWIFVKLPNYQLQQ